MTAHIEALTTATMSMALDAAGLRQQVIAANIANAGRPEYLAQRVSFEAQLAGVARSVSAAGAGPLPPSPFDLRMRVTPDVAADGQPRSVQLDAEVAALSQNTLHYQALVKGLSKHMAIMASAVTEGKR